MQKIGTLWTPHCSYVINFEEFQTFLLSLKNFRLFISRTFRYQGSGFGGIFMRVWNFWIVLYSVRVSRVNETLPEMTSQSKLDVFIAQKSAQPPYFENERHPKEKSRAKNASK